MDIPGFEPTRRAPSAAQIDAAEQVLGVRFPNSYRALLARFNGAHGGAAFPIPGKKHGASIGTWLSILPWDSYSMWWCLGTWPEHELPRTLVPFGADGGGNYVCFDYRSSAVPVIKRWHHEFQGEEALDTVAQNFDDFLKALRSDDD